MKDTQFALILLQLLRGTLERSFIDLVFTICCFSLKIPIWIEIICLRSEVRNIILVSLQVSGVLRFYKVVLELLVYRFGYFCDIGLFKGSCLEDKIAVWAETRDMQVSLIPP